MSAAQPKSFEVAPMPMATLEQLSAGLRQLCHDVNNALIPAFALGDLARQKMADPRGIDQLDRLVARLGDVREVLHSARAIGHGATGPGPPDIATLRADLTALATDRGVTMRWLWTPASCASWQERFGAGRLRLVLRCLIVNALDSHATSADGAGHAAGDAAPYVEVDGACTEAACWLRVADNGPGCLDPAAAARGQRRRRGDGHLGLGLTVAATLAERAGIRLCVASTGRGFSATFSPREENHS